MGLSVPQYFNEYTSVAGYGPVHTGARWVCKTSYIVISRLILTLFYCSITSKLIAYLFGSSSTISSMSYSHRNLLSRVLSLSSWTTPFIGMTMQRGKIEVIIGGTDSGISRMTPGAKNSTPCPSISTSSSHQCECADSAILTACAPSDFTSAV